MKTIIALALIATTATGTPPVPATAGIWSIGTAANCASGNAWVVMADGYYVEVKLPDGKPSATGIWRDDGATISYTHSHSPFADMMKPNTPRVFTVVARTADRLDLKTYRGDMRIFHRCPAGALKPSVGEVAH